MRKCSVNYFIYNFQKHCYRFNGVKYRFGKKNIKKYIKEIHQGKIYQTNKWYSGVTVKNGGKKSCLKRIRGYYTGECVGGSRYSLAR